MNKKYKIIQLVTVLDKTGGMEKVIAEIASFLDPHLFDVEIWCIHRGGAFADSLRAKGLSVKELGIKSYFNIFNIFKLANEFKEAKADLIHSHIYFASTIGRLAAKMAGVSNYICHVHSDYDHYTQRNMLIERFLSSWTSKIIVVSNTVKNFVVNKEKINSSKVEIIHNGISPIILDTKENARSALKLPIDAYVISIVANLYDNKGHQILFEAIKMLSVKYPNLMCCVVGQGPLEEKLKKLVVDMGLNQRILFFGERMDVSTFLSASDTFVLSSLQREGLPISVMEAMSAGLPIVISKVGGYAELITDGKSGLIVEPQKPQELALAIEKFYLNKELRDLCSHEAVNNFNSNFHIEVMIKKIQRIYLSVLK